MVIDDQMEDAGRDKRNVNLFTRGSHHRKLSVIYIVMYVFHQGRNSRRGTQRFVSAEYLFGRPKSRELFGLNYSEN